MNWHKLLAFIGFMIILLGFYLIDTNWGFVLVTLGGLTLFINLKKLDEWKNDKEQKIYKGKGALEKESLDECEKRIRLKGIIGLSLFIVSMFILKILAFYDFGFEGFIIAIPIIAIGLSSIPLTYEYGIKFFGGKKGIDYCKKSRKKR